VIRGFDVAFQGFARGAMRFIPRVKIAVGSLGGVQLIIGPTGAVAFVVLIEPRFGRFGSFLISRPYDGRGVFMNVPKL
jgi:hypothetical protein